MASGGGREFFEVRASEREQRRGGDGGKRGRRAGARGSGERGKARGRGYISRQSGGGGHVGADREAFDRREERRNAGRNVASGISALQLESTNGRGGSRPGVGGKREVGGRRGREDEKRPLDQLKRCEERVAEGIRKWRRGRANYEGVERLVASAWSWYVRVLMEGGMEQAIREGLGLRMWRNIHYPIVEHLRKSGELIMRKNIFIILCIFVSRRRGGGGRGRRCSGQGTGGVHWTVQISAGISGDEI